MTQPYRPTRRHVVAGLGAAALVPFPARAQDGGQAFDLQAALFDGAASGRISLPAGTFRVSGLVFPGGVVVEGVPGQTWLVADGAPVGSISAQTDVVLRDLGFSGDSGEGALLAMDASGPVTIERCQFRDGTGTALSVTASGVTVRDCRFDGLGDAAIHAMDCRELLITGNTINDCGNAGIRVWRGEPGRDGAIISNNRISTVDWRAGGNGQNGNGINIFNADDVLVASNHISGCAFTAVRLNTTNNAQVTGNTCLDSGEVAIFSEFAFSGSVIANNIIDGAATGISMTNMNNGGQIAVCTGNIVRNILPASRVNPDTTPIGIAAEAEAAITGNTVANVPGIAFFAGYGPYLRNVLISGNIAYAVRIGIGVSVVEEAGPVHIANNMLNDPLEHAMVGMRWSDVVETELEANVDRYPNVTIG